MSVNSKTSSVWNYFRKNGNTAICMLCKAELRALGTTGCLWKHLRGQHQLQLALREQNPYLSLDIDSEATTETQSNKRSRITEAIQNMGSTAPVAHRSSSRATQSSPSTSTSKAISSLASENDSDVVKNEEILVEKSSEVLTQPKITSLFLQPRQVKKKNEQILQMIAAMTIEDMLPLSFVESNGFRQLLKFLYPQFIAPCRNTIKARLRLKYSETKDILKKRLESFEHIALTTDTWTSRNMTSYITVTGHAITADWSPFSCNLATTEMSERHTADNIQAKLCDIIKYWNISNKICAVVHDNAKNVTNAIVFNRDLFGETVPCFAHTLQLCIGKGLTSSDQIISLLKLGSEIVGHFNHSNLATENLRQKQELLKLPQHKLIRSVKTRWNSSYYMLQRLFEQRQAIVAVLSDRSVTKSNTATALEMSESEWTLMDQLIQLLKPFEVATTFLCSEKNVTLSLAKPLMRTLMDVFLITVRGENNIIVSCKTAIKNDIYERFRFKLDKNLNMFDTTSLLDPRYVNDVDEAVKKLGVQYINLLEKRINLPDTLDTSIQEQEEKSSAINFLFPTNHTTCNTSNITETEKYFQEPPLNKKASIYSWWKDNQQKYPKLAILAKKYLSVPATSAPSERVFSTAGNIINPKRNCLLPANAEMLIFLYENRNL